MQTNAQGPARSAGSAERQKVRSRSSRMNALITQTTAAVVLGGPRSWQTATMPHHRISRVWTLPRIPAVLRGRARAFAGPGADAGPAAYRLTSGLRVSGCYRSWWWPGCCRRAGIGAACGSGPRGRERRCSRGGRSPQSAATACMASMRSSRRSSSPRASARASWRAGLRRKQMMAPFALTGAVIAGVLLAATIRGPQRPYLRRRQPHCCHHHRPAHHLRVRPVWCGWAAVSSATIMLHCRFAKPGPLTASRRS
jgi:hypothetical protein